MAQYMTIPDFVESEPLRSVNAEPDGKSFVIVIDVGDTATRLFHAGNDGQQFPLVVLALDSMMLALDEVYVTGTVVAADQPTFTATLNAHEVRFV